MSQATATVRNNNSHFGVHRDTSRICKQCMIQLFKNLSLHRLCFTYGTSQHDKVAQQQQCRSHMASIHKSAVLHTGDTGPGSPQFAGQFSLCRCSIEPMSRAGAACTLALIRCNRPPCAAAAACRCTAAAPLCCRGARSSTVSVRAACNLASSASQVPLMCSCSDACDVGTSTLLVHQLSGKSLKRMHGVYPYMQAALWPATAAQEQRNSAGHRKCRYGLRGWHLEAFHSGVQVGGQGEQRPRHGVQPCWGGHMVRQHHHCPVPADIASALPASSPLHVNRQRPLQCTSTQTVTCTACTQMHACAAGGACLVHSMRPLGRSPQAA